MKTLCSSREVFRVLAGHRVLLGELFIYRLQDSSFFNVFRFRDTGSSVSCFECFVFEDLPTSSCCLVMVAAGFDRTG